MASAKNSLIAIKDFFSKFGKNLTWIFFSVFLLLIVFEILAIRHSVDILTSLNEVKEPVRLEKGVRIDFAGYEAAIKRIKSSANFTPTRTLQADPFTTPTPTPIASSTPINSQ